MSYAWVLTGLATPLESCLVGPPYSNLRIVVPYGNIAGVAGLTALLLRQERWLVELAAGLSIAACWAYVRIVSFVV